MKFNGRETTIPKLPIDFKDCSWNNDICAHFEKRINEKYTIDIWIECDEEEYRESDRQYLIGVRKEEESQFEEFFEFDKNDFSESALNEVSRIFYLKTWEFIKKYKF
jgi:glutamate formiminotransferase